VTNFNTHVIPNSCLPAGMVFRDLIIDLIWTGFFTYQIIAKQY